MRTSLLSKVIFGGFRLIFAIFRTEMEISGENPEEQRDPIIMGTVSLLGRKKSIIYVNFC